MASTPNGSSKSIADPWRSPEVLDAIASLPRLIAVWPSELSNIGNLKNVSLLAKLRKALRAERQRGVAGHWTYDLARHAELLAVYRVLVAAHCQKHFETDGSGAAPSAGGNLDRPDLAQKQPDLAQKQNGPAR